MLVAWPAIPEAAAGAGELAATSGAEVAAAAEDEYIYPLDLTGGDTDYVAPYPEP
ncbi:MAG: hypothetical protein GY822_10640 [Deltaproteobacteria bacterium]|nr:hypothetical protein [Deltaproteobacteria bacterium]